MSHPKTLKVNIIREEPSGPFRFSDSFKQTFKSVIDEYSNALSALNKLTQHLPNGDYGVCACCYKLRYLNPKDISTYVANLDKAFSTCILGNNVSDISMFAVASVKRFLEENECVPFEEASMVAKDHSYVNPKAYTLNDLLVLCENDICGVCTYSQAEIKKRIELAKKDIEIFNKMHFAAAVKNVVDKLPNVMNSTSKNMSSPKADVLREQLESFIIFTCALNTISVYSIIRYIDPEVIYAIKEKIDKKEVVQEGYYVEKTDTRTSLKFANVYTECCNMLKTTNMMIRSKIPFDCNMRSVVLQDMTPNFQDTRAALDFILKDPRSPICMLVNQYRTSDTDVYSTSLISDMFGGTHYHFKGMRPAVFDKSNSRDVSFTNDEYYHTVHSDVNWLDNIAHGNNYLDGNYRRDAVGNHHVHPIENTLDIIYRIYGKCDLTTNEELADNIVKVSSVMSSLIDEYPEGPIENYDITKDVLVVLGEIMTRNMLQLYYNNTRVYDYSDDMPDALMRPYLESFVMEADENASTGGTNSQAAAAEGNKPNVSFANKAGQTNMSDTQKAKFTLGSMLRKFVLWIQTALAKLSNNFKDLHKKEIEWVNKNEETNRKILSALQNHSFNPILSNFPKYKILAINLTDNVNIESTVKKYLDNTANTNEINEHDVVKEMLPKDCPEAVIQAIVNGTIQNSKSKTTQQATGKNDEAKGDTTNVIKNYILTGTADPPNKINGRLEAAVWTDIIDNIKGTQTLIDKLTKKYSEDLNKATKDIEAAQKAAEAMTKTGGDEAKIAEGKAKYERASTLFNIVAKKMAVSFQTQTLNTIVKDFYGVSYKMYRDIVAGYLQQSKDGQISTNEQSNASTDQKSDQVDASDTTGTNKWS